MVIIVNCSAKKARNGFNIVLFICAKTTVLHGQNTM